MASINETARTTVTQEGSKALIKWLLEVLPTAGSLMGAAGMVWAYLYAGLPAWAVATLVGVATFLTLLFIWKLPALYRAVSSESYRPAARGWGYSSTVHLVQAACLLEDIEPQVPIPRKAIVWWNQLAFAMQDGELARLPPSEVKADTYIQMSDLRRFAAKRKLSPKCLRAGAP